MKYLLQLFLLTFLLLPFELEAQRLDHVQGEILVMPYSYIGLKQVVREFQHFHKKNTQLHIDRQVSKPLGIWAVTFDHTSVNAFAMRNAIDQHPSIRFAQFNHFIEMRNTPNDPQYSNQWQYLNTGQSGGTAGVDLDMELAWDITTGGLTADGDTIVVCILDEGIDESHEDLMDNRWFNHAEIPDNGLDDDNNGYIDDYRGWNFSASNNNLSGNNHGTSIAGIIGATGNNNLGVAGVNWNVKMMILKVESALESDIIEAFSYPIVQRQRYNESGGEEGAYVVATNGSWGVPLGTPEDAPIWCALYDTLGHHGILNCAAVPNSNVNIDEVGDLPATCPSDFLIAVTNVDHNDQKVTDAGVGPIHVDIGSFGSGVWTTNFGNNYGTFGGTSGATPHVTAAIGLLYAAPCPSFMAVAKSDPEAAALLARQYILQSAEDNASLDGLTTTGGRINISNALTQLMDACTDCFPPTGLDAVNLTDVSASLVWNANDSITAVDLRWRELGSPLWTEANNVSAPFQLNDLLACNEYEFQVRAFCGNTALNYTESYIFKTDGCCELPSTFNFDIITDVAAEVSWNDILAAESYNLRIRVEGEFSWDIINVPDHNWVLTDLMPCTPYEIQIQTLCAGENTLYSSSYFFQTRGCGACLDQDYCVSETYVAEGEWIATVEIAELVNNTGSDDGYGDYTGLTSPELQMGETYNITLAPGYASLVFQEYFLVWIDYNQNGLFTSNEIIFDPGQTTNEAIQGQFTIPSSVPQGNTRLRVAMQYDEIPPACNFLTEFGEVEDYCVEIVGLTDCVAPTNIESSNIQETQVQLSWTAVTPANNYLLRYKPVAEPDWEDIIVLNNIVALPGLTPCEEYEIQLRSNCPEGPSAFSPSHIFETACMNATEDRASDFTIDIHPNPFRGQIWIAIEDNRLKGPLEIKLLNAFGQEVMQKEAAISPTFSLPVENIPSGIYVLAIRDAKGQTAIHKLIKQ